VIGERKMMSTLLIDYDTSSSSPNRLLESVSQETECIEPDAFPVPGPFDCLTIALIGPQEDLRNETARALVASGANEVHAFASYPPSLDDMPALLMETHNVVIIELDSDPEFAVKLVERVVKAAPATATVMVYSEIADSGMLLRCMRGGVREFLVPPFDSKLLTESLARAVGRLTVEEIVKVGEEVATGRLLTFMGAKGGAGVTTVACNFAVALAQHSGQSTLLIDLDLPFGDVALNLGIIPEYSTVYALEAAERLDVSLLKSIVVQHSSGLSVLATSGKLNLYRPSPVEVDKLLMVAKETYQNVVVDIGTRLDLTETILFRKAQSIYLVTQAGIPELRNSNRLISQFFKDEGVPKLEIVLNRYEGKTFGVSDSDINRALTRPANWKVPNDFNTVRRMQTNATPLALENSSVSREIRRMARSLDGEQSAPEKKKAFSLFG
jgi:pilus assembly protein CpaE